VHKVYIETTKGEEILIAKARRENLAESLTQKINGFLRRSQ